MIRLRTLGTVDLRDAKDRELGALLRRPKLLALLGYLAAARPYGFHRRDTLIALLWPELDNAHARNNLRQSVHAVRESLGQEVLVARGEEELALEDQCLCCDVREFEMKVAAGQAEQAVQLYRGPLLSGLHLSAAPEFERWLDEERGHLRQAACDATQLLVDHESSVGNRVAAARWAQRLTELAPSDEKAARQIIRLLDELGDRAGAVHAYEELARRLARDLELEPSSDTQALVRGIRQRRPSEGPAIDAPNNSTPVPLALAERESGRSTSPELSTASRRLNRGTGVATFLVVTAVSLLTAGWIMFRSTSPSPKRLAVLPFANLGSPEDKYFADGMREELTARLTAIDRFRIVGMASADRYRNATPAEIGKALGVDYLLKASVRWQRPAFGRARVRVTPLLVNTKDGTEIWGQIYDEPMDEILRVQSDIAAKIVRALDVAMSDSQRRAISAVPTKNAEAYDFYLRGLEYARRSGAEPNIRAAAQMDERAVELDSGFAQAWSHMSRMYTRLYWRYVDHSTARLASAKRAADKAMELAPELPESHMALAIYYGLGIQDYDRSLREYQFVEARGTPQGFPGGRAATRFGQGDFRGAIRDYEGARQLDPANALIFLNTAHPHDALREHRISESLYDRAIILAPEQVQPYLDKVWLYVRWDGSTTRARAVLAQAERAGIGNQSTAYWRVLLEIFDRRYEAALALLSSGLPDILESDDARFVPRAQLKALIYSLTNRYDLARTCFDSVRMIAATQVARDPEDSRARTALGIAYAGLGRRQDAIREGLKAIELMPLQRDAFKGYHHEWDLARIYTMTGEYDSAISKLEYLLSIPGYLTPAWLRIDPVWDPLRNQVRFRKLVEGGSGARGGVSLERPTGPPA